MATSTNHPFTVWIDPTVLERANIYSAEALIQKQSEIGGFAKIQEEGQDVFVTDIWIPSQNSTAGTFEISADMDQQFMLEMIKQGRREEIPQWKSIFHSHPSGMSPSMSSVDVTAIQRRAEGGECYSLIISADRNAESERLYMHYCCTIGGKNLMFRDMPVKVGWDTDRLNTANDLVDVLSKEFKAETKSDISQIRDAVRGAICNDLPAYFEEERKELRKAIAAEVKEKVQAPARKVWVGQRTNTPVGFKPEPKGGKQVTKSPFILKKEWETAQRLFAIGYDLIDPTHPDPNKYVTADEAERARKLYQKIITELNTDLRNFGGAGIGDLVIVRPEAFQSDPTLLTIGDEPVSVEGFDIKNGLISYDLGDHIAWGDEIEVVQLYEDIMDFEKLEQDAKLEMALIQGGLA